MELSLETIGITQTELADRVVDTICDRLLLTTDYNEDGDAYINHTQLRTKLNEAIQKRTDKLISDLAAETVIPNVEKLLDEVMLQPTNRWGEPTDKKMTFREYLAKKAEDYLREEVNYEGKSQSEAGGYGWSKSQTRITHLINKHFHYEIDKMMKATVADANSKIAQGIQDAVKIKLEEILKSLRVDIKTKN